VNTTCGHGYCVLVLNVAVCPYCELCQLPTISVKARLTSVVIRIRILIRVRDPHGHQNLIICSVAHCQPPPKLSRKSVQKFFFAQTDKQTNKQRRLHILLGGGKYYFISRRQDVYMVLHHCVCITDTTTLHRRQSAKPSNNVSTFVILTQYICNDHALNAIQNTVLTYRRHQLCMYVFKHLKVSEHVSLFQTRNVGQCPMLWSPC